MLKHNLNIIILFRKFDIFMPDYSEGGYFLKTKLGLNYYRTQSKF